MTNAEYVQTVEARRSADGQQGVFERYTVSGVKDSDFYSDTNMQVSPAETLPLVQRVVRAIPPIQRLMTLPDVEKAIPELREALSIPESHPQADNGAIDQDERWDGENAFLDADAEEKDDRKELMELARRVTERRLRRPYQKGDAAAYSETIKEVQWQHKGNCGLRDKAPRDYTKQDVMRLKNSCLSELGEHYDH